MKRYSRFVNENILMKYLETFEKFSLPFFKKKIEKESSIVELPLDWIGGYCYNGEQHYLKVGDYTNRGIVKKSFGYSTYITDEGSFTTKELKVIKGDEEELKTFIDSQKYNL